MNIENLSSSKNKGRIENQFDTLVQEYVESFRNSTRDFFQSILNSDALRKQMHDHMKSKLLKLSTGPVRIDLLTRLVNKVKKLKSILSTQDVKVGDDLLRDIRLTLCHYSYSKDLLRCI